MVDRSGGPTACWPWRGPRTKDGYGRFRGRYAHRLALEAALRRPLAPGEQALHDPETCNRPWCCNSLHLRPGTVRDNARDRIIAGTNGRKGLSGDENPGAKLTAAAVVEMRAQFAAIRHGGKGAFIAGWAARLGVCSRTVEHVVYGKTWKQVELTRAEHARIHDLRDEVIAKRLTLAEAERLAVLR